MGTNTGHIMTLANSIIGVSVLAMPFCYKQCGIILASIMLIISSIMTRLSCYYLIKSAILARRRNFEFLAFHVFGPMGKLAVELCIIGFLLGTCIAFFVVMGDLGPAILGPVMGVEEPTSIRATVLIAIAIFVVLPLGLLRNVDSLAAISAATIAFYICLVVKVMGEATTNLVTWDWLDKVVMWRPAGLLQCIPIFSMALSCQTQLFEIFDSIPNATLEKMNVIVRSAVNMCTLMYMAMGFFGYVAFCTQSFSGNLMLSFSPTPTSEVIKMGFVLSVAVSFPLVIFPCRASLHSLLFRKGIPPHQELLNISGHMPEARFKCMTVAIVGVSLVTGMLIPNIELVLGLVGSTIGVLICIIMPASLFLSVATKHNNDRLLAQVLFCMGITIMVLGSYANLFATEELASANEADLQSNHLENGNKHPKEEVRFKVQPLEDDKKLDQLVPELPRAVLDEAHVVEVVNDKKDIRKEPPVPVAPEDILNENHIQPQLKVDTKDLISNDKGKSKLESNVINDQEEPKVDVLKMENEDINAVKQQEIFKIEQLKDNKVNGGKDNDLLKDKIEIPKDLALKKFKYDVQSKNEDGSNIKIERQNIVKPVPVSLGIDKIENPVKADVVGLTQNKSLPRTQDTNVKKEIQGVFSSKEVDKRESNLEGRASPSVVAEQLSPKLKNGESVKSAQDSQNINERNPNLNELRKEILNENNEKRQREKRDLEELGVVVNKNEDEHFVNEPQKNIESNDVVKGAEKHHPNSSLNTSMTNSNLTNLKNNTIQNVQKNTTETVDINKERMDTTKVQETELIKKEKNDVIREEVDINGQCSDDIKTKSHLSNLPRQDNEMSQSLRNDKTEIESEKFQKGTPPKTDVDSKKPTESIIKSPVYLSNPVLILTNNRGESLLDNNNNINNVNSLPKPMKRDLKSLDATQERKKKRNIEY